MEVTSLNTWVHDPSGTSPHPGSEPRPETVDTVLKGVRNDWGV